MTTSTVPPPSAALPQVLTSEEGAAALAELRAVRRRSAPYQWWRLQEEY